MTNLRTRVWSTAIIAIALLIPFAMSSASRVAAEPTVRRGQPLVTPSAATSIWSIVPSPNRMSQDGILSDFLLGISAVSPTDVWSVGYYCCAKDTANTASVIEHWNGAAWSGIASPPAEPSGSRLIGVAAISSADAWAVGWTNAGHALGALIEHWDGATWSVVPSPHTKSGSLAAITALAANNIWAVGSDHAGSLVIHWNGIGWSVVPTPSSGGGAILLTAVSAVNSNDIWAVGEMDHPNSNALALHWDGTQWRAAQVAGTFFSSSFSGITAISSNDVWAVGYEAPTNADHLHTFVEHWNGTNWSLMPSPNIEPKNPPPLDNALLGVAALASGDIWAVGYYIWPHGAGTPRSLFEHWNGTVWELASGPPQLESNNNFATNGLQAITAVAPGLLWAVGSRSPETVCCDATLTIHTASAADPHIRGQL